MALSYTKTLWLVIILVAPGELAAVMAATGAVSMEVFAGMPLASREMFTLLAVAAPFGLAYFILLATRNFEDLVATETGIAVPVRSFREMIRGTRSVVPYADVESVRFFERRGAQYVELRLRPAPKRRTKLILPSLWIPNPEEFWSALSERVPVIGSPSPPVTTAA